jgi:hypothetical protein
MNQRRGLLLGLIALLVSPAFGHPGPHLHPHRRRVRRVRRRVMRRRIRRRVLWRAFGPRRLLVVPLAIAVGWELMVDDRVVVVHEVHVDHIIVKDADGKTEKVETVKEDNADNAKELEGSQYEVEEEVEEEIKG